MAFLFETTNDVLLGVIVVCSYVAPIIVVAYLFKKITNAFERKAGMRA